MKNDTTTNQATATAADLGRPCYYCGEIHDETEVGGYAVSFFHDFLFVVKSLFGWMF